MSAATARTKSDSGCVARFPDGKFENSKVIGAGEIGTFEWDLVTTDSNGQKVRSLAVRWRQSRNQERISQGSGMTEVHPAAHFAMCACHQIKSGAPTISRAMKPTNGDGGIPTRISEINRPTPPQKIMNQMARNSTV